MKITAIITEYNPFHNGHQYQLNEIKKQTDSDYIIVIMSGDFTQRGTPAIAEKKIRTKAALACGVDLVIQLPVLYSTGSARLFAEGAISILDALGCVDTLVYGTEHIISKTLYQSILDIFTEEPEAFRLILKDKLESGLSFPAAREAALCAYLTKAKIKHDLSLVHKFFSSNNILGLEYELALIKLQSSISTLPIPRIGNDYHDLSMNTPYASASGIRELIERRHLNVFPSDFMPHEAADIILEHFEQIPPVFENDLSSILYYALLNIQNGNSYLDCTQNFINKIKKNINAFESCTQFAQLLKSKELTHSRISRSLLHILLNIKEEDVKNIGALSHTNRFTDINYARILGFRKKSAPLLHEIEAHTSIPLISKMADAKKILNEQAMHLFEKDIYAAELYHGIERIKSGQKIANEYESKIVFH